MRFEQKSLMTTLSILGLVIAVLIILIFSQREQIYSLNSTIEKLKTNITALLEEKQDLLKKNDDLQARVIEIQTEIAILERQAKKDKMAEVELQNKMSELRNLMNKSTPTLSRRPATASSVVTPVPEVSPLIMIDGIPMRPFLKDIYTFRNGNTITNVLPEWTQTTARLDLNFQTKKSDLDGTFVAKIKDEKGNYFAEVSSFDCKKEICKMDIKHGSKISYGEKFILEVYYTKPQFREVLICHRVLPITIIN